MNKKLAIKILAAFMVSAVALTYVSKQVYNSTLPVVTTTKSYSASLQARGDAVGKIVYQDTTSYLAPVDVIVDLALVKTGQQISQKQEMLRLDVDFLETKREQLKNQIAEAAKSSETEKKRSETVLLLQLDIARMELSLFRSNSELEGLIEEKNNEADVWAYKEKIAQTNVDLERALGELYLYEDPLDPYSEEISLKLAVLQAKNNLIHTDADGQIQKDAAELAYEAALYKYVYSLKNNAQEAAVTEKKLELSVAQYEEQLAELREPDDAKKETQMEMKELKNTLNQVEALIKDKGMLYSKSGGEITELNVQADQRASALDTLAKICTLTKEASVQWKMDEDDFSVGDEITADLTVYETLTDGEKVEIVEVEKQTKLRITARRFIAGEDIFEYTAEIPQPDPAAKDEDATGVKLAMSNNQSVKISMNKSKDEYDTVVPISAIPFIDEHKGTLFCVVQNKQGNPITRKIEVEILDYDSKNAALEKTIKDKIVVFSDRPMTSEGVVREDV